MVDTILLLACLLIASVALWAGELGEWTKHIIHWHAPDCDDATCQRTHLIHVERDRRRRTTAQHAFHTIATKDCDRCDADRRA